MKLYSKILIAILALTAASGVGAQNTVSPYSKFGFGLLDNNATAAQMQMGGVGYAMSSGRQINVMNPASYAAADSMTFIFDMGIDFTRIKSSEIGSDGLKASHSQFGGGLDYITMQVPLSKRLGASFGVVPYSSVGYSFGSEIKNGMNSRQGAGGLNQLYLGLGGKVFKGFSVGFNVSYLFGNIVNDVTIATTTGSQSLFEQVMEVRDYRFQFGAQYKFNISSQSRIGLGVVYSPAKKLLGDATVIKYDLDSDTKPDTVSTARLRNHSELSASYGAGISWEWQRRLLVEADFTYQPWSKVKNVAMPNFEAARFDDSYRVGLGAAFTPKERGGFFQRITYRAGGFYNRDYTMIGNNHVKEYGAGFGFGLPAWGEKTVINLGFEYRHRGADNKNLLQENYFNIRLGINFDELWFFKNKIQ